MTTTETRPYKGHPYKLNQPVSTLTTKQFQQLRASTLDGDSEKIDRVSRLLWQLENEKFFKDYSSNHQEMIADFLKTLSEFSIWLEEKNPDV